jgi:tetratricopeptide (TPR) repeat protein
VLLAAQRGLLACLAAGSLAACSTARGLTEQSEERALTLSVSELQMYLRTDTYRSFEYLQPDGQNAFQVALWRLDRLREYRAVLYPRWKDQDIVVEYARARALEQLRRYAEAAEAYQRVAWLGGLLARPAADGQKLMELFAAHVAVSDQDSEGWAGDLERIDAWSEQWMQISRQLRGSSYAALALQEAESWEQTRLELLDSRGELPAAIDACQRMIERHRDSKLYPRHLIRLGDLHAEAARQEYLAARTRRRDLDTERYERQLEAAFSAYELASESRKPPVQHEAQTKIQALLAIHEGVRNDLP